MRGTLVLGCSVLFVAAVGCGSTTSMTDGGGSDTGGSDTGGTDTGGGDAPNDAPADGSGGPRTVTLTSADAVAFAAGQDGDGAWRQLTAVGAAQSYTLDVTGARYGLAYGCANAAGDSVTITVLQSTVAETTRVTVACGGLVTANPVTVTGMVAGLSGTQTAQIDLASRSGTATVAAPAYSVAMVPTGAWDLFARRMTAAPTFDRMIRRNAVTVGAGATFNVDFGAEGFAPETRTVTFQGATAAETTSVLAIFRGLGGSPFGMGPFSSGSYLALPAAELRTGDIHSVTAGALDSAANTRRGVRRTLIASTNFTATLPTLPPAPTITVGSPAPYVRPRATIPSGSALDFDRYDVGYTQRETAPARTRSWSMLLTRGWIAAAAASDYTVPDLSGLAAFQAWWGLIAALDTQWQQFANWDSAGVADLLRADQTAAELDGHEYKSTQRSGQMTF